MSRPRSAMTQKQVEHARQYDREYNRTRRRLVKQPSVADVNSCVTEYEWDPVEGWWKTPPLAVLTGGAGDTGGGALKTTHAEPPSRPRRVRVTVEVELPE